MATRLFVDFSDAQGQIIPYSAKVYERTKVATTFLPSYVYGDFSSPSREANSAVHDRIWSNFELIRDFIVVLVTCKNKEGPI